MLNVFVKEMNFLPRKQKDEKTALDAKCKKVSNQINETGNKRMGLMEKENQLMPTTIEEFEEAIQDTTSQANSILFVHNNILKEYEDRQRQIEDLATKLDADKKGKWLPTLRNLVAQINEIFSQNFQQMAVAGEVSLDEHDMDFDKFGILIKVKFRENGHLEVLSAHHQSGGERSVSTIVYLVSLQDLTN